MENNLVKVLLQNKRKTYIDKTKMKFYVDNKENQMFLNRTQFFVNDNGDFNVLINPEWSYNIYSKDNKITVIKGKEVIAKLREFLRR